ncbi:hypothetical protein [Pseudomonas sp. Z4-20]|uniref:hypothetical protein n=1 Tax=Pseudomonas sp. Z4-20 TaxID=2817414 RepID=UPI003DA81C44
MRPLIQQAQPHWRIGRLQANVYAANIGSVKVLQRCGLVLERSSRDETGHDDWYGLSI